VKRGRYTSDLSDAQWALIEPMITAWHILVFGYLAYVRRTRFTMLPSLQDRKACQASFISCREGNIVKRVRRTYAK